MSDAELDAVQSEFANMEHVTQGESPTYEDGATSREQDMYASFFKDAHTSLYHGCEAFSKMSFLVNLYHLKCLHGWTQESFTPLLGVLSAALPPGANLPKTYYEAKKIIRGLGLDYVKIHACPKDCMLFRGDRAYEESCHVCGSSPWKNDEKNGSPTESKRKKKPSKVLRYFPLIPRIQRLFATDKTSDDMRWHDEGRTKDGKLRHPADGQAWKDFDSRYPEFSEDARNEIDIANYSQANEGYAGLALPREYLAKLKQGSQNKKDQKQVFLMSQRHKNKVVGKGNLVTTDSTHVVGGNMLGKEFYGVAVHIVGELGDERLPTI